MRVGGRILGSVVILLAIGMLVFSLNYTNRLQDQRDQAIEQLMSLPQYEECRYDSSMCPHVDDTLVLPDTTAIIVIIFAIVLGVYLIRSDHVNGQILSELQDRKSAMATSEKTKLIMSVLTKDERKIVEAVRAQPGISQATLRLRTDFSKAKLSSLLKELERRNIVARATKGKTNIVQLKRDL